MKNAWLSRVSALACAWLAACGGGGGDGGGGGGGSSAAAPNGYFPLSSEARWFYTGDDGTVERVDVVGTAPTAQGSGTTLATTDDAGRLLDRRVAYADGTGVTFYPTGDAKSFEQQLGPITLLRFPASVGQSYTQVDKIVSIDLDLDGRNDRVAVKAVVTVIGRDDVTVPAGQFPQALHVRTETTETATLATTAARLTYRVVVDDWYVEGVGLVRTTQSATANGTPVGAPYTQRLTAYRVAERRSESTPPTVESTAPAQARASTADVSVTFSEPIDARTLAAGWQIVDGHGNLLSGQVTILGNVAHFVPDAGWANGTYTSTLTTAVTDRVGNPLPQASTWQFSLDAVAPTVLRSTPANAAANVPSNAPIVVEFSEPIDPASVQPGLTMDVRDNDGSVAVTAEVSGASLTIRPVQGWKSQKQVQVRVDNITDVYGNPMTQSHAFAFLTDSGRFDYPKDLTATGTQAVAIVDLDGDGVADFVYIVPTYGQPSAHVRYGRADGTLEAAVPLVADDLVNCGSGGDLDVVDLDGDGRRDVVVGASYCGWRVLRQTAPRRFVLAEQANVATATALEVVDLDGDGRLDAVGLSYDGTELLVWQQDATRRYTPMPTRRIPLPVVGRAFLRVADLDGDGRPDLVAAGAYVTEDLVVFRQQADGSFVRTQSLLTGEGGARGLAIGDVDGDGRPDLVVTAGGNVPVYLAVFTQRADRSYGTPQRIPCLDLPSAVAFADLDGDGLRDVVVTHSGWFRVGTFMRRPDGTLGAESLYVTGYGSGNQAQLAIGDLTGDGQPDLVVDGQLLRQRTPDSGPTATAPSTALAAAARRADRASSLRHAAGAAR